MPARRDGVDHRRRHALARHPVRPVRRGRCGAQPRTRAAKVLRNLATLGAATAMQ
jgi:hypothetical protein